MAYDVKIVQQPPCGLLNLRGAETVCQRYDRVLGFELPYAPNTTAGNKDITAMWLGPDEWLIKTEDGKEVSLADALREAAKGLHAAVTPVSDSCRIFRVSGVDARAVLAQGTAVDLHPGSFSPGRCARTSLGKTGVTLHQLDDLPSYDVYVWRSYAEYLRLWLDRAAGTDISTDVSSSLP